MATACMLAAAGFATAHYAGPSLLEVTEKVGTPDGYRTYRVLLHFTDPADELVAVGSGRVDGIQIDLQVILTGGIFNSDGKVAGHHLADVPGSGPLDQQPWDTWLTITQNLTQLPNPTQFTPGFIDPAFDQSTNPIQVLVDGLNGFVVETGGWYHPGSSPISCDLTATIAQFTVAKAGFVDMSGVVTWKDPDGAVHQDEFAFPLTPDPVGACCLAGGGCITTLQYRCEDDLGGVFQGDNTQCELPNCLCPSCVGDLDKDGDIDFDDFTSLLASWGRCDACPADLDGDGDVDFDDMVALLAAWGPCQ